MLNLNPWTPPTWAGQVAVVVASGPSLTTEQLDLVKKSQAKTVVINDNYRLAPWADILYGCDSKWWDWHREKLDLLNFKGVKVTQNSGWNIDKYKVFVDVHDLKMIESSPNMALSTNPKVINQGQNSGYQAINLAYHTGVKRIILIGYDMKFGPNNEAHWFGEHPDKVRSNYAGWALGYLSIAEHAKKLGIEIINCTIDTALTCFPRQDLKDVL